MTRPTIKSLTAELSNAREELAQLKLQVASLTTEKEKETVMTTVEKAMEQKGGAAVPFKVRWEEARTTGTELGFYLGLFGLTPERYDAFLRCHLDGDKYHARISAGEWRNGGKEALNALAKDLTDTGRVTVWWHKDHLEVKPKQK